MESSPRPGYYPDPSVPGYIRYWDGSKWVPGTSKPMPAKVGGGDGGDAVRAETGAAAAVETAAAAQAAPLPKTPAFAQPRPLSEVSFDDAMPDAARPAPPPVTPTQPQPQPQPQPGFPAAAGVHPAPPPTAATAGMGISITGAPGLMPHPPKQTPAQLSAGAQALRIRLLRPDGKPFDGPEITTGPKNQDAPKGASRTEFDAPRSPKKQAPKLVVKTGPLERAGHTLAVLLISAIGIVPLSFLMLQSVHDRESKLAATITVPTKMNVLNGTSDAYLAAMAAVLAAVAAVYWMRLKRRRAR